MLGLNSLLRFASCCVGQRLKEPAHLYTEIKPYPLTASPTCHLVEQEAGVRACVCVCVCVCVW